jgi:hypothetical protein
MGRISQYPLDTDIQGNDKWIGTSINNANATKNFSVDKVFEYLNKSGGVDAQSLRYTYQNADNDAVRLATTISFATPIGDSVPFSGITEWIISAFSKTVKDVRTYYDAPLVGSTILITHAENPSNWAIFRWDSSTVDLIDANFYHIGLTHIDSAGSLEVNEDYLIALLDYGSASGAAWGGITGTLSAQTDLQNALNAKQVTLVSGTNIKTINSTTILGSGDLAVQPILVSGTNIKTINGVTLLGSGDITISGSAAWGSITGTLSTQTDLQNALNTKVPYTGATANVDLGEFELKAGQVEFDQTPTGTNGVGVMRWNDTDGTVDLVLKGGNVTLQVGQEQVTRVVNKSGGDFLQANYQAVRINGAQGNRIRVALALADSDANSAETLGLVTETILNNQEGFITSNGLIRDVNTTGSLQGETWADGDVLYLSGTVSGRITNIKPTAPVHTVIIGYVIRAHATQGQIYVKVDNGYELGELHNVSVNSAVDNDILQYDSATTLWTSVSLSGAGIQPTLVSGTNIKTINGTTLLGSGDITISASPSGVAGAVQFSNGSVFSSDAANLFWDDTNNRLGVGINVPTATLHSKGSGATSATSSFITENSTNTASFKIGDSGIITSNQLSGGSNYDLILLQRGGSSWMTFGSISGEEGISKTGNFFLKSTSNVVLQGVNTTTTPISFLNASTVGLNGAIGSAASYYAFNNLGVIVHSAGGSPVESTILKINNNISITAGSSNSFVNIFESRPTINQTGGTVNVIGYTYNPTLTSILGAHYGILIKPTTLNGFGLGATLPTASVHIKGSGNTAATTNFRAENSDGTASFNHYGDGTFAFAAAGATKWSMRDTFYELIAGASLASDRYITRGLQISSNLNATRFDGVQIINGAGTQSLNATSGNYRLFSIINNHQSNAQHSFNPSSGTATLTHIQINTDIQQTGTATGRVVGIEYTPTLTSITGTHYGLLIRPTTLSGFGLGATLPTATVHIKGSGATSATNSFKVENSDNTKSITFDDAGNLATNGQMAIGQTTAPNASSMLEVVSTTKGALLPRMTTTQRNAIATPATGLIVYDTDLLSFYQYNGTAWVAVGGGGGSGTVTSVAALTLATTGTDLSSTVANSTTTPVITLNVPTASAANRGALNSSDWTTFNDKQKAITSGTAAPAGGSDGDIYLQYV